MTESPQLDDVRLDDEQKVGDAGFLECSDRVSDLLGRAVQSVGVGRAAMLVGELVRPICGVAGVARRGEDPLGAVSRRQPGDTPRALEPTSPATGSTAGRDDVSRAGRLA